MRGGGGGGWFGGGATTDIMSENDAVGAIEAASSGSASTYSATQASAPCAMRHARHTQCAMRHAPCAMRMHVWGRMSV